LIIFDALKKEVMKSTTALTTMLILGICGQGFAQITTPGGLIGSQRAITTAVPFLSISPDARHAALGDAGVASSPDAYSAFWNAGKLAFIDKKYGGSLSYTPWLGKIINDMWIASIGSYYKINQTSAVGLGFKYFDLGEIVFNTGPLPTDIIGVYNPKEMALDVTYSRMLSENLGVGLSGRYIFSNLTGAFSGPDAQAGNSVATDIGVYYTKPLQSARNSLLSLGAQISNIGAKLSYTDNNNKDFLPTNLKLGGAFTTQLDPYNTITFLLDFNKLLVPSVDSTSQTKSLLSGMFGSFSDAPGGGSEELREIMTSAGVEYWYRDIFAARLGYFLEAKDKGDRKYMTVGIGFRRPVFGIDMAYIVPTNQREHPLAETLRFTIHLQIQDNSLVPEDAPVVE
jgi:hypothetical protein